VKTLQMVQTFYSALAALSLAGSGLLLLYIASVARIRGLDAVNRTGSAAWETVAEAYEKRISQLETSLHEVQLAYDMLRSEYEAARDRSDALVKLNLQLQTANAAQCENITRLEEMNRELTRQLAGARG
jgi:DNA-binding transcriptional regulator YbjK